METEGEAAASCLSGDEFINVPPLENHYRTGTQQQQPVGLFHTNKGYFPNVNSSHTEKCHKHMTLCSWFISCRWRGRRQLDALGEKMKNAINWMFPKTSDYIKQQISLVIDQVNIYFIIFWNSWTSLLLLFQHFLILTKPKLLIVERQTKILDSFIGFCQRSLNTAI